MASTSSLCESKHLPHRRQSCDTVCSSNSSCYLHKRKPVNPLANSIRTYVARSSNSTINQRVLSARLLKLRSLQNQLNDANFHLTQLQQENKALKNLQTRQDKALSRYEGTNADLPRLLQSHEEEIRMVSAKNKSLRKKIKDIADQLKTKEEELASVREQHNSLVALTKHKRLGERQALMEEVEDLKDKLGKSEDQITVLNRKIQLEAKNYKYKLNTEMVKTKRVQKELTHALGELDRLANLLEGRGKYVAPINRKRFVNVNQRQSVSLITLTDDKSTIKMHRQFQETSNDSRVTFDLPESKQSSTRSGASVEDETDNQSVNSEVKLEPISKDNARRLSFNSVMASPTANVKARLAAGVSTKTAEEIEQLNRNLEHLNLLDSNSVEPTHSITITKQSTPNSSKKLEKISSVDDFDSFLQKPYNTRKQNEIEKHLGNVTTQLKSTLKDCNDVVDGHVFDYETAKTETTNLLKSLRETDSINAKLRYSQFLEENPYDIPEHDADVAKEILSKEYRFRKNPSASPEIAKEYDHFVKSDKNGNLIEKDVGVAPADKSKLLATLRAIDNGDDDLDEIKYSETLNRKSKLMKELFGDFE